MWRAVVISCTEARVVFDMIRLCRASWPMAFSVQGRATAALHKCTYMIRDLCSVYRLGVLFSVHAWPGLMRESRAQAPGTKRPSLA